MKRNPYLVIFFLGLLLSVQNLLTTLETKNVNRGTNNGLISKPKTSGIIIEDSSEFSEGILENLTISDNGYLMLEYKLPPQPNWINMGPSTKPSARCDHSMAYDSTHDKVILFGGEDGTRDDETWVYDLDTNTWTNMNPSTKPSARIRHSIVYDSTHDKVLLFGGNDGTRDDETWAYDLDTNTWTNMNPSTKPSVREEHSLVYDSTHDKTILFGGVDALVFYDDTWAYDLDKNTWTNMNPSTKPSQRQQHSMVYDSTHDKTILFGGSSGTYETWVYDFDTNIWTILYPSTKPSGRQQHSMVFDSTHDKVILFGGWDGTYDDETWAYDLDTNIWTNMNPSTKPSARIWHSMAYDSTHDKIILFGGDDGSNDDVTCMFRLFNYQQTGKFDSRVTNLYGNHKFSCEILWSPENQPVGTNLTVQIGYSNNIHDEDFMYTSPKNSSFTFAGTTSYIRYRVNFESTDDLAFSPILENIMIGYSTEIVYSNIQNINSIDESEGDTIIREENSLAMVMIVSFIGVLSVFILLTILNKRRIKILEAQLKLNRKDLKSKVKN